MCGIAGFAGFRDDELLGKMCVAMEHRGPDEGGTFCTDGMSIGMRRLAIIDVAHGQQPMVAEDGKIALIFNGAIYNYRELRAPLIRAGRKFNTHSDTEVILAGYQEYGLGIIDKLIGMFAIAIIDRREKPVLYLIRDRFGVKPLYYHRMANNALIFASELKAILCKKDIPKEINPPAVDLYLRLRYVPGEQCLLKGFYKLPPGSILKCDGDAITIRKYWMPSIPETKRNITLEDAVEELGVHLETSVRRRLVADVPVGSFLSGGLDSGLMTAIMAKYHGGGLNTFSVGFGGKMDETALAAQTASFLGTRHHEIICRDADFADIDKAIWHLDEPVGDAIILPTYLLAKEARKHVKVVLGGEGADEVFGGYLFHKTLLAAVKYRNGCPSLLRAFARKLLSLAPHQAINIFFDYPSALGKEGKHKLEMFLREIEGEGTAELFRSLITLFSPDTLRGLYTRDFSDSLAAGGSYLRDGGNVSGTLDSILGLQYRDWLSDLIMLRFDKMTMANSLEGREPYLDHEMFDFVGSLPDGHKIKMWKDKVVLRRLAEKYLPMQIAHAKKKPFYIPLDEYFGGKTFKGLFESFREENYLGGIISSDYITNLNLGNANFISSKQLFSLIALNRWFKLFMHPAR